MREYQFLLTCILPFRDSIVDFVLIWENTGSVKTCISHILRSGRIFILENKNEIFSHYEK